MVKIPHLKQIKATNIQQNDNHFNLLPSLLPLPDLSEARPKSVPNKKLSVHV